VDFDSGVVDFVNLHIQRVDLEFQAVDFAYFDNKADGRRPRQPNFRPQRTYFIDFCRNTIRLMAAN